MIKLTDYRGHIRNWEQLCEELGVDKALAPKEREKAVITAGYEKWGNDIADHLYGMFAFAIEDNGKIFAVRDHFGTK
ncbi:MAG: asparagine synthetase B, partial [Ruminococcus sp.]|nr:asparagine synthetase B [Ruminococcus sp.]